MNDISSKITYRNHRTLVFCLINLRHRHEIDHGMHTISLNIPIRMTSQKIQNSSKRFDVFLSFSCIILTYIWFFIWTYASTYTLLLSELKEYCFQVQINLTVSVYANLILFLFVKLLVLYNKCFLKSFHVVLYQFHKFGNFQFHHIFTYKNRQHQTSSSITTPIHAYKSVSIVS